MSSLRAALYLSPGCAELVKQSRAAHTCRQPERATQTSQLPMGRCSNYRQGRRRRGAAPAVAVYSRNTLDAGKFIFSFLSCVPADKAPVQRLQKCGRSFITALRIIQKIDGHSESQEILLGLHGNDGFAFAFIYRAFRGSSRSRGERKETVRQGSLIFFLMAVVMMTIVCETRHTYAPRKNELAKKSVDAQKLVFRLREQL